MPTATLHLTKLAAAERQLRAAIRLYFAGEDELAIHTVASAAYSLLADLKTERGMDEAANAILTSIFYVVRDYRRGTLPNEMTSDPELMEWVRGIADQLPIDRDTEIGDVSVAISRKAAGEFWNRRNKVANFLKHADRDSGASISVDEVNNLLLLMQCYSAYIDITRNELGNEGFIFQLFLGANRKDRSATPFHEDELVQRLAEVKEEDRLHLCSILISQLNEKM